MMDEIPKVVPAIDAAADNAGRIVGAIRKMMGPKGRKAQQGESGQGNAGPVGPNDIPEVLPNTSGTNEYRQDGLKDPGILNQVAGSGFGPEIRY